MVDSGVYRLSAPSEEAAVVRCFVEDTRGVLFAVVNGRHARARPAGGGRALEQEIPLVVGLNMVDVALREAAYRSELLARS